MYLPNMSILPLRPDDDRRATPVGRPSLKRILGESVPASRPVGHDAPIVLERHPSVVLFVGEDPSDATMLEEVLRSCTAEEFKLVTVARRTAALDARPTVTSMSCCSISRFRAVGFVCRAERCEGPGAFLVSPASAMSGSPWTRSARARRTPCEGRFDGSLLAQTPPLRDRATPDAQRARRPVASGRSDRPAQPRGFVTLATQDLGVARREKRPLLVAFGTSMT